MNENKSALSDDQLLEPDGEPPEPGLIVSIADQQSTLTIDESLLRRAVQVVLRDSPYNAGCISIAVVDDPTIHEINRQYLNHDYPTDVLSFVLEDCEPYLEGELVVSADTAVSNATEYDWRALDELLLYVVHGALHLVGYLDKLPGDIGAMRSAEQRVLGELGVDLPNQASRWTAKEPPS